MQILEVDWATFNALHELADKVDVCASWNFAEAVNIARTGLEKLGLDSDAYLFKQTDVRVKGQYERRREKILYSAIRLELEAEADKNSLHGGVF